MPVWLKRTLLILGGLMIVLALVTVAISYFADERLRAYFEDQMNERLDGYQVRLEGAGINLLALSVTLENMTIVQEKHPEPPVAKMARADLGLHWRALLSGRLVGQVEMERPRVHINLEQLREETADEKEVGERGWQEAFESIYPFKIDLWRITEGELTYIDQDPERPLRISNISLSVSDIRNLATPEDVYPSPFHLEATVFEKGTLRLEGEADLLARPHLGIRARVELANISLNDVTPILSRYNVYLNSAQVDTEGELEYSPRTRMVRLNHLRVHDLHADYIHTGQAQEGEEDRATDEGDSSGAPDWEVIIGRLQIQGEAGLVHKGADPNYRLFLSDMDLQIDNFSQNLAQGPAEVKMTASFMGSGATVVKGTFRPQDPSPDFDLDVKIEDTDLTALNDVLMAYGNFDVHGGSFTLFSELQIKDDQIEGYVRPFFEDVDVYDRRKDADKSLFKQLYRGLIDGLATLLGRGPEDVVAGEADIEGEIDEPDVNTWQLLLTIIQNAFFQAILPGFNEEVG